MQYEEVKVNSERWFDLTPLLNEEFRDIEGFEEYYQVSNYGRIKSLERYVINNGTKQLIGNKIITLVNNGNGYLYTQLSKNKKIIRKAIHRLIAETFLNKEEFKSMPDEDRTLINLDDLEVNHKDENTLNNHITNLEWCTSKYNANYGMRNKKCSNTKIKLYGKKVNQYDLNDNFISCMYMSEAVKIKGVYYASLIKCCKGKIKYCGGYKWKYAEE